MRAAGLLALAVLAGACSGPVAPAVLDPRHDACAWCRMTVSDPRFAAQLAAPGEEPLFFDDIGCMVAYLRGARDVPTGAAAFVADHRTRAWVPAARALFSRVPSLQTPMDSHLLAHTDAASRDADPQAVGGEEMSVAAVFRPAPIPGGEP
ncbi:MAG: nitrous oxide reductase accessory protein NosL [Acidobacteriota bacterium]